jgi:hypothetical protein
MLEQTTATCIVQENPLMAKTAQPVDGIDTAVG